MSQLTLTHERFYRHFHAKKILVAEVFVQGCKEAAAIVKARVESVLPGRELHASLDCNLGPAHRDNPSMGYALGTFGAELACQPRIVRNIVTKGLKELFAQATSYMSEDSHKSRRD